MNLLIENVSNYCYKVREYKSYWLVPSTTLDIIDKEIEFQYFDIIEICINLLNEKNIHFDYYHNGCYNEFNSSIAWRDAAVLLGVAKLVGIILYVDKTNLVNKQGQTAYPIIVSLANFKYKALKEIESKRLIGL